MDQSRSSQYDQPDSFQVCRVPLSCLSLSAISPLVISWVSSEMSYFHSNLHLRVYFSQKPKVKDSGTLRLVPQSCPTLCDPMDCIPPGSSVHGILQARMLEWAPVSSSRASSWPRGWIHLSCSLLHWPADSLPTEPFRTFSGTMGVSYQRKLKFLKTCVCCRQSWAAFLERICLSRSWRHLKQISEVTDCELLKKSDVVCILTLLWRSWLSWYWFILVLVSKLANL